MKIFPRAAYRASQFWRTLFPGGGVPEGRLLLVVLSPAQIVLFKQMHPAEQRHAWTMLESLRLAGASDPDLLTAALLHDVGKILAPLTVWERVVIVLGRKFLPGAAARWGGRDPRPGKGAGLARPFVVMARHPEWGADLAAEAGASLRACELIRCHQEPGAGEDALLAALQAADDKN